VEAAQAQALFLEGCARNGVLTNGNLMPSLAHGDEHVERTQRAFSAAGRRIGEVVNAGRRAVGEWLRTGFAAGAHGGGGFLDAVRAAPGGLELSGWLLLADGPVDLVEAVGADGTKAVAVSAERPDLAAAFPGHPHARGAGFRLTLPARAFAHEGDYQFTLRASRAGREVFYGRAVRLAAEHRAADRHPTRHAGGVLHL
jgi:hypothetical protein